VQHGTPQPICKARTSVSLATGKDLQSRISGEPTIIDLFPDHQEFKSFQQFSIRSKA
jgi:hypothetical protein